MQTYRIHIAGSIDIQAENEQDLEAKIEALSVEDIYENVDFIETEELSSLSKTNQP